MIDQDPAELRRSVRIPTTLHVRVVGHHKDPLPYRANVSAGGIFLQTDESLSQIRGLEHLELLTPNGNHHVLLPVACVRVVQVEDAFEGTRIEGIAYQFVPRNEKELGQLRNLLASIVAEYLSEPDNLLFPAQTAALVKPNGAPKLQKAKIGALSSDGLALLMQKPAEAGSEISLVIKPGTGDEQIFHGKVRETTCVTPKTLYRIDVGLVAANDKSAKKTDPMDSIIESLVHPVEAIGGISLNKPLTGEVGRFPVRSIYEVVEREGISGVLSIEHADDNAQVFISGGRPVDVEASWNARTPELAMKTLLDWDSGKFTLQNQPNTRPPATSATFSEILRA